MKLFKWFVPVFLLLSLIVHYPASAKDMGGRFGLGFVNEFANSTADREIPLISGKYSFSKDLAGLLAIGFNTNEPSGFTVGAKIFKNIFYESNLNFYNAAGFAFLKGDKVGIEILALIGAEFFIPGVESLGLSFEAGASVANPTGSFKIRTVGFTFLHAGMHFYF